MIRGLVLVCVFVAGLQVAPIAHAVAPVASPGLSAPAPAVVMPVPMASGCYYANCTQARQAGETDIPSSSPHYCSKLDRDDDGIACES